MEYGGSDWFANHSSNYSLGLTKNITNSSTGLRNVCTFPAKKRSKVANITSRGELGVS